MPVAAPLIGGAASIAGAAISKPKKQVDPNAYLAPYLNQGAQAAQSLFAAGGPQVYEGSTVAGPGDATRAALDAQIARGQAGSPLVDAAQGYVQQGLQAPIQTMFGEAANPYAQSVGGGETANPFATATNPFGAGQNPGLDAAFDYAAQKTRGQLEGEFARAGRNIEASAPARQDVLSTLAAQIYAPAYESERNRQLAYGQQQLGIGAQGFESGQDRGLQARLAAQGIGAQGYESGQNRALTDIGQQRALQQGLLGYATPLAAQDYLDLAQQREAGGAYDAYAQAQLSDEVARFNAQQAAPQANLDAYLARLQGLKNSTGPAVQPQQPPNYLAAGLGGALAAKELFPYQRPAAPVSTFTPQAVMQQPFMQQYTPQNVFRLNGLFSGGG